MPFVRPVILQLVAGAIAVHVIPLLAVTRYEVTGSPPSSVGAFHEITVEVSPATTARLVGALGGAAGLAVADTVENADSPLLLIAETVKV